MMTGPQCHAARALVDLTREQLATLSGLDKDTITRFERQLAQPSPDQLDTLEQALESLGATFIHESDGGIGVRLKFGAAEARQVATMEDEGGMAADDKVL
ncbi:helix-turn-helix domain-containing protein [Castellaniella hirudinis]|uniref:helix-turn-helix domain-containing protein n=1 Tax=Castellaniella hirudinis TaxID=1144617 RepID=UPI0039C4C82B